MNGQRPRRPCPCASDAHPTRLGTPPRRAVPQATSALYILDHVIGVAIDGDAALRHDYMQTKANPRVLLHMSHVAVPLAQVGGPAPYCLLDDMLCRPACRSTGKRRAEDRPGRVHGAGQRH